MRDHGSEPSLSLAQEDRDAAYQLFVQEAVELFQEIETDLRQAAQNPGLVDQRQSIVQAAQIIKSGAAQLNLTTLQYAMQRIEVLCSLSQPHLRTRELDMLCQVSQTLKLSLLAHDQQTSAPKDMDCAAAQVILVQLEKQLQKHQKTAAPAPSVPVPPSEDKLTALAITAEVEERLSQLESHLARSSSETLATDLSNLFESLRDLGEMSNLSQLVAISQTALTSLQASPQTASTIGQIALAGYREASSQDASQVKRPIETNTAQTDALQTEEGTQIINLDISDAFVWQTAGTVFVLPSDQVLEIVSSSHDQMDETLTPAQINWQNRTLPVYPLTQFIRGPQSGLLLTPSPSRPKQSSPLLIIQQHDQIFALQIEIERLITVSTLELHRTDRKEAAYERGSTFLEDNQIYTVVDMTSLIAQSHNTI